MLGAIRTGSVAEELCGRISTILLSPKMSDAEDGFITPYRSLNLNLIIVLLAFCLPPRPHNRASQTFGPSDLSFDVRRD